MAAKSFYGRISVLERNLSQSVILDTTSIGATVIPASQGPEKPLLVGRNQASFIYQVFGYPSATNRGVWEAVEYNKYRPIWISAPSKSGKYGGVFVTKQGTIPFTNGISTAEISSFSNIAVNETIGVGDGLTKVFSFTLDKKAYYINQSIDLLVNGVSINISATDVAVEVLTTTPDVGSGTYNRTTGVFTFTFTTAPLTTETLSLSYNINLANDCYFAIIDRDPQVDNRALKVSMSTDKVFTLNMYQKSGVKYNSLNTLKVSMTEGAKDVSGGIIDIREVLYDDVYFNYILNPNITTPTTFVNDTTYVDLKGGSRGATIDLTDLTRGWNYFKNKDDFGADIFFDTTADAGIPSIFVNLRENSQRYKAYILPLPKTDYATAITNKSSLNVSNRGIYYYWNWGRVRDNETNTTFWTTLTGAVAVRHALMDDVFNGLAPAMINDGNHGGQLSGVNILEMAYSLPDDELAITLDANGINPIVKDRTYGYMITSHKTSLTEESDWSYIAHSRLDDWIIDNIVKQILPYQVVKLNDVQHQALVRGNIETIVSAPAGSPFNLIEEYLVKCDMENNNEEVRSRREFLVEVYIKHTRFSERVKLIFSAVDTKVNIQETFG